MHTDEIEVFKEACETFPARMSNRWHKKTATYNPYRIVDLLEKGGLKADGL